MTAFVSTVLFQTFEGRGVLAIAVGLSSIPLFLSGQVLLLSVRRLLHFVSGLLTMLALAASLLYSLTVTGSRSTGGPITVYLIMVVALAALVWSALRNAGGLKISATGEDWSPNVSTTHSARAHSHAPSRRGVYLFGALSVLGWTAAFSRIGFEQYFAAVAGSAMLLVALTYVLTADDYVKTGIVQPVYAAISETMTRAVGEEWQDTVYVPTETGNVRLLVPRNELDELSLRPSGVALWDKLDFGTPSETDFRFALQLFLELLTDELQIVSRAEVLDVDDDSVVVTVDESPFGSTDRFDHPVVSFLATGIVQELEKPVRVEVSRDDIEGKFSERIELHWDA